MKVSPESGSLKKLVIVTGGSRGIGRSIVEANLKAGYQVVSVSSSGENPFPAEALCDSVKFDLGDTETIGDFARGLVKDRGVPFALINNAGIGIGNLHATAHDSEISRMLRVNLEAPLLMAKYFGRAIASAGSGRIVNISSITARVAYRGLATYAATKSGLEAASRVLARELGPRGVTVNCVAPGFIRTQMSSSLTEEDLRRIRTRNSIPGDLSVNSVANAVLFLLSDESSQMTGQVLTVDSGATL